MQPPANGSFHPDMALHRLPGKRAHLISDLLLGLFARIKGFTPGDSVIDRASESL